MKVILKLLLATYLLTCISYAGKLERRLAYYEEKAERIKRAYTYYLEKYQGVATERKKALYLEKYKRYRALYLRYQKKIKRVEDKIEEVRQQEENNTDDNDTGENDNTTAGAIGGSSPADGNAPEQYWGDNDNYQKEIALKQGEKFEFFIRAADKDGDLQKAVFTHIDETSNENKLDIKVGKDFRNDATIKHELVFSENGMHKVLGEFIDKKGNKSKVVEWNIVVSPSNLAETIAFEIEKKDLSNPYAYNNKLALVASTASKLAYSDNLSKIALTLNQSFGFKTENISLIRSIHLVRRTEFIVAWKRIGDTDKIFTLVAFRGTELDKLKSGVANQAKIMAKAAVFSTLDHEEVKKSVTDQWAGGADIATDLQFQLLRWPYIDSNPNHKKLNQNPYWMVKDGYIRRLRVNAGFFNSGRAFLEKRDELIGSKSLQQVIDESKKTGNFMLVAGHSLGGAAAQVFAATMRLNYDVPSSNLAVYTFGSPAPAMTTAFDIAKPVCEDLGLSNAGKPALNAIENGKIKLKSYLAAVASIDDMTSLLEEVKAIKDKVVSCGFGKTRKYFDFKPGFNQVFNSNDYGLNFRIAVHGTITKGDIASRDPIPYLNPGIRIGETHDVPRNGFSLFAHPMCNYHKEIVNKALSTIPNANTLLAKDCR